MTAQLSILCVEDDERVARSIEVTLGRAGCFEWKGWLNAADRLKEVATALKPALLLVDIDMPGKNPFEVVSELAESLPECRAVVFSGHVLPELIDRALDAGVWGYVSKNDCEHELVESLRQVSKGEVAMSTEVRRVYHQ